MSPAGPPRACCRALTAECMACSQGISVQEYCISNPDTTGCDSNETATNPPTVEQEPGPVITTQGGATTLPAVVPGNDTVEGGGGGNDAPPSTPAPPPTEESMSPAGPPRACCRALTAECMACSQGISVQEYCISNPDTIGCDSPPAEPIAAIPEEVTTAGAPDDASTPASPADDAANATNTTTAPVSGGRRLLRAW